MLGFHFHRAGGWLITVSALPCTMATSPQWADEPNWDYRDQAVLDAIEAQDCERVSLSDLQKAYQQLTDVRARETMRERIKFLVENGPFDEIGTQTWEYTG